MIVLRITMNVLPEKQKEVRQTLVSMTGPTGKDKGCLGCEALCNLEDKNIYSLIEEWKTREDLDRHIRSEKFRVLLGAKSLLKKPLKIQIHTVSLSEGIESVHAARGKRDL